MSYNKDAAAPSHPAWESSDSRSRLPGHGQGLFPGFGFPLPHPAGLNCSCPYACFESEPANLLQRYLEKVSPVMSLSPSKSKARKRKWKKTTKQKHKQKTNQTTKATKPRFSAHRYQVAAYSHSGDTFTKIFWNIQYYRWLCTRRVHLQPTQYLLKPKEIKSCLGLVCFFF